MNFGKYKKWLDPLYVAEIVNAITKENWLFLHSSLIRQGSSRYSIICFNPLKVVTDKDFESLKKNSTCNLIMA